MPLVQFGGKKMVAMEMEGMGWMDKMAGLIPTAARKSIVDDVLEDLCIHDKAILHKEKKDGGKQESVAQLQQESTKTSLWLAGWLTGRVYLQCMV